MKLTIVQRNSNDIARVAMHPANERKFHKGATFFGLSYVTSTFYHLDELGVPNEVIVREGLKIGTEYTFTEDGSIVYDNSGDCALDAAVRSHKKLKRTVAAIKKLLDELDDE